MVDLLCIVQAFLCFFFPPLAIFLKENCTANVWIDLVLLFLGFLPGILFALYIVFFK